MKKVYLLTLGLAALLLFGYMPITANAMSAGAQGTVVGDDNPGAGDVLPVGQQAEVPDDPAEPDTPDDPAEPDTPDDPEQNPVDIGENDVPLNAGEGDEQNENDASGTQIDETGVPLASSTQAGGFSWWGFLLGLATGVVIMLIVMLATRKRDKGSEEPRK